MHVGNSHRAAERRKDLTTQTNKNAAELQAAQNDFDYDEDDAEEGYDEFMAGGSADTSYISYGGK